MSARPRPVPPSLIIPVRIHLPPPVFSSDHHLPDPCDPSPASPSPSVYYTAPSSPFIESSPPLKSPPSPPSLPRLHIPPTVAPHSPDDLSPDEPFPSQDMSSDFPLDEDVLSPLEKIYLFSRSNATFHRVFILHAMSSFLEQVTPLEAHQYVLPLLRGLAMDHDETVKEALATELVSIIWWFFAHCRIVPHEIDPSLFGQLSSSSVTHLPVQAFTPILGTLLLSPNPLVGGVARDAVVVLLLRMKQADEKEITAPASQPSLHSDSDLDDQELVIGLFGRRERAMFRHELIQQVIIGLGRLDMEVQDDGTYAEDNAYEDWSRLAVAQKQVSASVCAENDTPTEHDTNAPDYKEDISHSQEINQHFSVLALTTPSLTDSPSSTPSSTTGTTSSTATSSPASTLEDVDPPDQTPSDASTIFTADTDDTISLLYGSIVTMNTEYPQKSVFPEPQPNSFGICLSNDRAISHSGQTSRTTGQPMKATGDTPTVASPIDSSTQVKLNPDDCMPSNLDYEDATMDVDGYEAFESDQAAVGRCSSMSLMAAVAASGSLGTETKVMFVKEVERVGRDQVLWVRREASFALGALAKVVPQETVVCSLLPLFEFLRLDAAWQVRHSALFALPAILSRLLPEHRRLLALGTVLPFARDESPSVRSGVLETLGEVIYTFHEDVDGPPGELLHLFLGKRKDRRVRDGQQQIADDEECRNRARQNLVDSIMGSSARLAVKTTLTEDPQEAFFRDANRPLVCAFNFPAVTLTLGRARWSELRETYLQLTKNPAVPVRRTLAASLGQMAKIIGAESAARDLMGVWWNAIQSKEEVVRRRAVGCVTDFVGALDEDHRGEVVRGLLRAWNDGLFREWRERERIAKELGPLAELVCLGEPDAVRGLMMKGLQDIVGAVRDASISAIPLIWTTFSIRSCFLDHLRSDVLTLATSDSYRKRMTYIACVHVLISVSVLPLDDPFLASLVHLADDTIVGVRIGLARLVGSYYASNNQSSQAPTILRDLVTKLSHDTCHQVRSYIPITSTPLTTNNSSRRHGTRSGVFSKPPPASSSVGVTGARTVQPDRKFSGERSQAGVTLGAALIVRLRELEDRNTERATDPETHNSIHEFVIESGA